MASSRHASIPWTEWLSLFSLVSWMASREHTTRIANRAWLFITCHDCRLVEAIGGAVSKESPHTTQLSSSCFWQFPTICSAQKTHGNPSTAVSWSSVTKTVPKGHQEEEGVKKSPSNVHRVPNVLSQTHILCKSIPTVRRLRLRRLAWATQWVQDQPEWLSKKHQIGWRCSPVAEHLPRKQRLWAWLPAP